VESPLRQLGASDIKRLKELEQENVRLTRMYADLSLEHAALKNILAIKLYDCCAAVS
jgi:putative transposase